MSTTVTQVPTIQARCLYNGVQVRYVPTLALYCILLLEGDNTAIQSELDKRAGIRRNWQSAQRWQR